MVKARTQPENAAAAASLDITGEVCPMTFVRTKLALEKLPPGAILAVRLRGEEPRRNVPRSVREEGHEIVALEELGEGVALLRIRRR